MIDITLLGCGGGMPMPDRHLSSTILNNNGRKILIDCGEGTQVSMRKVGCGFKSIDVILVTHCHGDHTIGIPGLLLSMGGSGRLAPVTIVGPKGITDVIRGFRATAPILPFDINIIENPANLYFKTTAESISENNLDFNLEIETLSLNHSIPCFGYTLYFKRNREFLPQKAIQNNVPKHLWKRLQNSLDGEIIKFNDSIYTNELVLGEERRGIKLSVITDTRPIDTIPTFINDSDLLICEANYGSDNDINKAITNKHMTFREAATLAKLGNCKQLLLTHFSPAISNPNEYFDNASSVFKNTIIGNDGLSLSLQYS